MLFRSLAGTYVKTLVNAAGCDSIAKLVLVIKDTTTSTTNAAVCNNQLPYLWNGINYNLAGTYVKTLVNAAGCDSIAKLVLVVSNILTGTTTLTICDNQVPFLWNGNTCLTSGTYSANLKSVTGCDSIATLLLTVSSKLSSITNKTICSDQLPLSWNNINYTLGGTYSVTLKSVAGCDSIVTLILTINTTPSIPALSSNSPLCSGKTLLLTATSLNAVSYKWVTPNGQQLTIQNPSINNVSLANSGAYSVTATANGCISSAATTYVSVILTPIINAGTDLQLYEGDSGMLKAVATGTNLIYKWTPNLYFISPDNVKNPWVYGVKEMAYSLTVTQNGQCPATDIVVVKVLSRLRPIDIPNVFSPNNDGKNDVWVIKDLAPYPESKVEVFTRSGQNVFSALNGYKLPWDGTYKGKPMPVGTYYYIVSTSPQSKVFTGWVAILR